MKKLILSILLLNSSFIVFTSEFKPKCDVQKLFYEAIDSKDIKTATDLLNNYNIDLDMDPDEKYPDGNYEAPFFMAIDKGFPIEFIELLIKKGSDVNNICNAYGRTPLLSVIYNSERNDNDMIVRILIENGVCLERFDHEGSPYITIAVSEDSYEIVKLLLENSEESINMQDYDGDTALIFGIKNNVDSKIIKLLIDYDINLSTRNSDKDNALDIAFMRDLNNPKAREIINLILGKYHDLYKEELDKISKKIMKAVPKLPIELANIISDYKRMDFIKYLQMQLGKPLPKKYIEFINDNFLRVNKRKDLDQDNRPAKRRKTESEEKAQKENKDNSSDDMQDDE